MWVIRFLSHPRRPNHCQSAAEIGMEHNLGLTGEGMRAKYKETSLGGLAVNVVEC